MPYQKHTLTETVSLHSRLENASPLEQLHNIITFIPGKLYFGSFPSPPPNYSKTVHFFSIDSHLVYVPFFSDFGPSNAAHVYRFCQIMNSKLSNPALTNKYICLYSGMQNDKRSNAAFLMCCFMMLTQNKSPEEAYKPFVGRSPLFLPYRDAGYGSATYLITILDCLKGLHKAISLGIFSFDSFNLEEYEFYEKVENGDLNWITKKFIAFANPPDGPRLVTPTGSNSNLFGRAGFPPTPGFFQISPIMTRPQVPLPTLIKFFVKSNVTTIVRLNRKLYDKRHFMQAGIDHVDLYFPDGTTPSDEILLQFLELCESRDGVVAVHCKAGLGRTGTLIAAYFMRKYLFTASEIIGFLRVLRPGSVVGPQQNYLRSMQAKLWAIHDRPIEKGFNDIEIEIEEDKEEEYSKTEGGDNKLLFSSLNQRLHDTKTGEMLLDNEENNRIKINPYAQAPLFSFNSKISTERLQRHATYNLRPSNFQNDVLKHVPIQPRKDPSQVGVWEELELDVQSADGRSSTMPMDVDEGTLGVNQQQDLSNDIDGDILMIVNNSKKDGWVEENFSNSSAPSRAIQQRGAQSINSNQVEKSMDAPSLRQKRTMASTRKTNY